MSYQGWCDAFTPHALKNKKNERVGIDCVTPQTNRIEEGLDYLITHFYEPIWPRTISTKTTLNPSDSSLQHGGSAR